MKKTVAFVPVKLNNERLLGKNTKSFENGKPLISYILNTLRDTAGLDDIYVYCSNEAICDYLPEGVKFLKRDERLDLSSTLILEVLQSFANDVVADVYVLAHATAPFLRSESIAEGIESVLSGRHSSALTVTKVNEFLWVNGKPLYDATRIPRTQDLEEIYQETTGLYIYTRDLILKEERRTGDQPYMIKVDRIEAVDINDPLDFDFAQAVHDKKLYTKGRA